MEPLLAKARASDADLAARSAPVPAYAGEADPYKKPADAEDDPDDDELEA
jgi:ribosome-binding factor A